MNLGLRRGGIRVKQREREDVTHEDILSESPSKCCRPTASSKKVLIKEKFGGDYHEEDLICAQPTGEFWKPSAFTSAYRDLLRRRKLNGPNFHAVRHSHASHLLREGVDLREVSALLGHARAGFALNTYAHLLPGQDQEAARRIDIVLRKAIDNARNSKVM